MAEAFRRQLPAKYGDNPEVYAANYYEGIYIVAE